MAVALLEMIVHNVQLAVAVYHIYKIPNQIVV